MEAVRTDPPINFGPYFTDSSDAVRNYHLTIVILPIEVIDRLTMAARCHAAAVRPNPLDNRGDNMFYAVRDKERVGLIRHCLINRRRHDDPPRDYGKGYDNLLHRIDKAGIDVEARQLELKLSVLKLIGSNYPILATECEYQRWRLLTALEHAV